MWFVLSLIAIAFWGGSDLFSKIGSKPTDKYSHWKIVMAVGLVMGIHATVELLLGAKFQPIDFVRYLPATALYIGSMILGYVGLRYIMLSVSSPICNSSGAVACILCLIFLKDMPDIYCWIGIVLVCIGVIGLAFVEKKNDAEVAELAAKKENKKYTNGFIAIFFPIFYCVLDGLGTFADALLLDTGVVNEESANIAYEYTFLFMGILAAIYVFGIKKEKFSFSYEKPKLAGAVCETAGQFAYIYAIGANAVVAAPMISAYCVFSVVLSRIFLKEKLSLKHYLIIFTVFAGIIMMGVSEGLAEP
ncbi:MAG: EamA family transporter [Clostridia bacterium]|nr:EamA family transporter [Clostridia bacterium]